ncbi:hypothetical protein KKD52_09320 [Myxococcota bacterium]|nr:hypothetical protein [Myxococcota bacterium]
MKHSILFSLLLAFWVFSGCSLLVEVKEPPQESFCGNGQIDHDEECDADNLGGDTCQLHGFTGGQLGCTTYCVIDTSGCTQAYECGNGTAEAGEMCDGGDLGGKTCMDLAFESGTLSCFGVDHGDSACTFNTSQCVGGNPCGNEVIEAEEQCDGANHNGQTCESLNMGTGTLVCKDDCSFDTSNCYLPAEICDDGADNDVDGMTDCDDPDCQSFCAGVCGDGWIGGSEECDGDILNGQSCMSLNWGTGDLTCVNCQFDPGSCSGTCGDGFVGYEEECDGTASSILTTCSDWGFYSGSLSCNGDCRLDFSQCTGNIGLSTPTLVSSGQAHTCTIIGSMMVYCWGWDQHGQLGIQSGQMYQPVPVPLSFTGTWMLATHLSAGGMHTCAVSGNVGFMGIVLCWGNNTMGQIGNGSTATIEPLPVPILNTTNITKVAAGFEHTCALNSNGYVYCWGSNTFGQLGLGSGYGTSENQPTHVTSLTNIIAISAGFNHTCAIQQIDAANNELYCWGANDAGQLGVNNNYVDSNIPVKVLSFNARAVACGQSHTCGIKSDNSLWCWGANDVNQLGYSGSGNTIPVQVPGFTANAITAGANHTCAILGDGKARCWGRNVYGQLGFGYSSASGTPEVVPTFDNVSMISGGGEHTCAIENNGGSNFPLYCWGGNWYGQVGNGNTADQYSPALVMGQ